MKYRLANRSDIDSLARIHYIAGKSQVGGFMHRLGLSFLKVYYKIHLNDQNSIIWVAEDEEKLVRGFVSGTLDAERSLRLLNENRFRILISILPAIFVVPKLLPYLKERYDFVSLKDKSDHFGTKSGPRIDYWAWDPAIKGGSSLFLMKIWLNDLFSRNVYFVHGEVDKENGEILTFVKMLGAIIIDEHKLKDGRSRIFIKFVNKNPLK